MLQPVGWLRVVDTPKCDSPFHEGIASIVNHQTLTTIEVLAEMAISSVRFRVWASGDTHHHEAVREPEAARPTVGLRDLEELQQSCVGNPSVKCQVGIAAGHGHIWQKGQDPAGTAATGGTPR